MAIDLTGIVSVNEYYTHHYLNTILEEDIKDIIKKLKEEAEAKEEKTPWSKLRELSKRFYTLNEKQGRDKNLSDRYNMQREFLIELFNVLGYDVCNKRNYFSVKDNEVIPVLHEVRKNNGAPLLWIIESIEEFNAEGEILHNGFKKIQFNNEIGMANVFDNIDFEEIISKYVFSSDEPPRWILLSSYKEVVVIDRTKWGEKRVLDFKLDDIFSRKEESTLQAMVVLLHKTTICPDEGSSFLDTLSENSHKHASSVSEDLKYALRECIELLGNEAIRDMRERQRAGVFNRDLASRLTIECLRYMYRILFLLYIEARPELGYAPMKSEEYLKGYSIESLRDIADKAKLDSDEAKNGNYIDRTLKNLFKLIYNGFNAGTNNEAIQGSFKMEPLKAHIFDPDRTEILNKVHFRNEVLIKIIRLMSISRPNGKKRPGRISYAQLGINQLGAVYEALLSYRGFLAEEDLYEVKRAGDKINELEVGYFVTKEQLSEYDEDERVRNEDDTLKMYPKGTFIYRLAGREREKSASYYTPEVLTKSLVKYALKELLVDKTADEILELTICEPAMGSAAFLNETVNQLAEKYLELKQKETGISIPHDEYTIEKQKVKMYIADRNVYGVDLNPIAVELAEVSLWLNTIYSGAYVPWFGLQLVNGNSLVGARKQVYQRKLLSKSKKLSEHWYNEAPVRVNPGEKRPPNSIYHFLLGDPGMVDYKDKVIKELAKDKIDYMNKWKKEFISGYTDDEIRQLLNLSSTIDILWEKHAELRKDLREKTKDRLTIFGHNEDNLEDMHLSTKEKDKILKEEYYSEGMMNAGPYARLKFAMDYWCALWYWPIEKAEMLPTRAEFLLDLSLILEGDIVPVKGNSEQMAMGFIEENQPKQQMLNLFSDELGQVDLQMLCSSIPRLRFVQKLSTRYKYHHWELEFADIFKIKEGFDLIVGNPPWLKLEWKEQGVLGDINSKLSVKNYSATETARLRNYILDNNSTYFTMYLSEYEEAVGTQNFLNSISNYPYLVGVQTNLFKCFLPQSWMINNKKGTSAFIHPEGVYDDPNGGKFRRVLYQKLKYHFQFINEKVLFKIDHHTKFSINIYSNKVSNNFITIANLFEPKTIDDSMNCTDNIKDLPGIKDDNGNWSTRGHKDRVIKISKKELKIFSQLYDGENMEPLYARLPAIHSNQILSVMEKFADQEYRLANYDSIISMTEMLHETNRQKDGTIKRITRFPDKSIELILSGPQIGLSNPLYKTPRKICKLNSDYDIITSEIVKKENARYLPRTNYIPNISIDEYLNKIPRVSIENSTIDFYRIVARNMIGPGSERTLVSALIPPNIAHTQSLFGITILNSELLVYAQALFSSIPYDFIIKTSGKNHFRRDLALQLPIPKHKIKEELMIRTLLLNCMTEFYEELWRECWYDKYKLDQWGKQDYRLNRKLFSALSSQWNNENTIINDFERRQLLIEIDVLTAMILGMTLKELKTIYKIQFPVLRSYEGDTWYDKNGRIIFTNNRGLVGVGINRKQWNEVKDMKEGTVIKTYMDDTMPGGLVERTIVYEAPFDRCDREKDYEEVWKNFEERFKDK